MAQKFKNQIDAQEGIKITNELYDGSNAAGTSGQVLSSTGTGTQWIDSSSSTAERIEVTVKNVSGGSLSKGTVVHAAPTATPPSGNVIEVIAADANVAANMPAIGVLNETIADEAEGAAVMFGAVSGIDTSSFSIGDELYVSTTAGEFTATKPTATTELVQKIAVVIKSHASNGLIKVFGAGRSNDVPNLLTRDITIDGADFYFGDSDQIKIGDGSDFKIQHNGTNSFLENYTGGLYIDQHLDDGDIIFRNDDGSGGLDTYIRIDGSSEETLFLKKIRLNDNVEAHFGTARDLKIYHDSNNSWIRDTNAGNLYLDTNGDFIGLVSDGSFANGKMGLFYKDGAVKLYYDNSLKLETTNTGVSVTADVSYSGTLTSTGSTTVPAYFRSTASVSYIQFQNSSTGTNGTSDGLTVGVNGLNGYVWNRETANLYLGTNDTTALTLDSSQNATFAGDVTVTGDLIVNGTETILNTQTVEVEDNIIQLNTTQGSPDTATATTSGISIYRGDGVTQASFIFDDTDDTWDLTNNLVVAGDVTVSGGDITLGTDSIASNINSLGDVLVFNVDSNANTGGTPNMQFKVSGTTELTLNSTTATFAGNIILGGNYVGRDTQNYITFSTDDNIIYRVGDSFRYQMSSSALFPYADSTYDLGTTSLRWANVWADNINGGSPVKGSGTANYIPKWSDSNTLTNSAFYDSGSITQCFDNFGVYNTSPYMVISDTNATTTTDQVGYISMQINGTESGWIGFGGSSNNEFGVRNTNGPIVLNPTTNVETKQYLKINNVGSDRKIEFNRTGGNQFSIEHDASQIYFYNTSTTKSALSIENGGQVFINPGLVTGNALKVYYDMMLYDTLKFTNSAFTTQGTIKGANGALEFKSNGSLTAYMNAAQRMGIGTSTDIHSLLTLSGNTNSYTTAPIISFNSTSTANANVRNWAIGPADSAYGNFHIFKSSARGESAISTAESVMVVDYTGKVGIGVGTYTVSEKLDVHGNAYLVGVGSALKFDTTGANASNGIKTINDYETLIYNGRGAAGHIVAGNSSIRLGFGTNYTNAEADVIINTTGIVLIGTDTVAYSGTDLHIGNTSDSQNGIQIQTSTTGYGYILFGDGSGTSAYRGQISYNHSLDRMEFVTAGSTNVVIDSAGQVGIHNTIPSSFYSGARSLVVGDGSGEDGITIYGGSDSTSYLLFADGTSGSATYAGQVRYVHSTNSLEFATSNLSTAKMAIDTNGNVGIRSNASLRFNTTADSTHAVGYDATIDGSFIRGQNGVRFITGTGGGTERARINSSGQFLVECDTSVTTAKIGIRQNGSSIEFGHDNQTNGYYGTLGATYSSGHPFIAFSCYNNSTIGGNNFATTGHKGNVIYTDSSGNLYFAQATTATSSSQGLTTRMVLSNDGNVRVGGGSHYTGSGVTSLTVNDNLYPTIALGSLSANRYAMIAYSSAIHSYSASAPFLYSISGVERFSITTGGIFIQDDFHITASASYQGFGWNRNVNTGAILNSNMNAFQMFNDTHLKLQGYNSSGTNQFEHIFYNDGNTFFDGHLTLNDGAYSASDGRTLTVVNSAASVLGHVAYDTVLIQQTDAPTLRIYESGDDIATTISSDVIYSTIATTDNLRFYTNGSSTQTAYNGLVGTHVMTLNTSGYVLIGQTSDLTSSKVQINGFVDITKLPNSAFRLYDGTTFIGGMGDGRWAFGSGYDSNLGLYANDNLLLHAGTGSTIDLFIRSDHRIGSSDDGTVFSPSTRLHLKDVSDAQLTLEGRSNTWAGIFWRDVYGSAYTWFYGSTQTWAFGGGGSAVSGKRIHCDGGMTIGSTYDSVTMPTDGLWVQGTIKCADDIVAFDSSDKRLKDNIRKIEKPLDKLDKINGYKFKWNTKQDIHEGEDYGVIAQEVEEVMPEIVNLKESGYYGVKYDKLIPLLIESVKELSAEVQELKKQINGST